MNILYLSVATAGAIFLSGCEDASVGIAPTASAPKPAVTYDSSTSLDKRNAIHCSLYKNGLGNLVFPQKYISPPTYADGNSPANKHSSYDLVHAFADLGGDGIIENITMVTSFEIPRVPLPMFIWSANKSSSIGSDNYGLGEQFGIKVNSLEITQVLVDDLNGDGVDDLVFIEYGEHDFKNYKHLMKGTVYVALSNGHDEKYTVQELRVPTNLWHRGVTVDYDYDGDKDIVVTGGSWGTPKTYVLVNDGHGTFRSKPFRRGGKSNWGTWSVNAGDIDQDGFADIFTGTSNESERRIDIYWGGRNYSNPQKILLNLREGDAINDINYGDFDGDGDNDLSVLVAVDQKNVIIVIEMQGREVISINTISSTSTKQTAGRLWGLSYIYSCDGNVLGYYNRKNPTWLNVGGLN